jgi:hypothetical protein
MPCCSSSSPPPQPRCFLLVESSSPRPPRARCWRTYLLLLLLSSRRVRTNRRNGLAAITDAALGLCAAPLLSPKKSIERDQKNESLIEADSLSLLFLNRVWKSSVVPLGSPCRIREWNCCSATRVLSTHCQCVDAGCSLQRSMGATMTLKKFKESRTVSLMILFLRTGIPARLQFVWRMEKGPFTINT